MKLLRICSFVFFITPMLLYAQRQAHCKIDKINETQEKVRIEKIRSNLQIKLAERTLADDTLIIVPVAIHFKDLEDGDRACFEAMALSQIEVLNNYFNRTADRTQRWQNDSTFYPEVQLADLNVEFRLANKNHPSNVDHGLEDGDYAVTFDDAFLGILSDIDWAGYLNIVCFYTPNTGIGTYGSSPIFGDPSIGARLRVNQSNFGLGISCDSIAPTPPFHLGGIAAHEIGHFLGLDHTFTGSCDTDDGIEDTPNQLNETTGNPEVGSVSSCNEISMTMNIMDYTDDLGIYMFSAKQGEVMRAYLEMISHTFKKDVFIQNPSHTLAQQIDGWKLFPNPATNDIQITSRSPISRIMIYNSIGKLAFDNAYSVDDNELYRIPIGHLSSGVYFIKVFSNYLAPSTRIFYKL